MYPANTHRRILLDPWMKLIQCLHLPPHSNQPFLVMLCDVVVVIRRVFRISLMMSFNIFSFTDLITIRPHPVAAFAKAE